MKLACIGYRNWAMQIYENIMAEFPYKYLLVKSFEEYSEDEIIKFDPNYILFYGWSWIVSKKIYNNFKSVMLHPSPLPKYRGGSPIQNQIIRNEKESAVTLFFINGNLDAGDIIGQKKISLEGHLDEIFGKIVSVGTELTRNLLTGDFTIMKQNELQATTFKRRRPEESEITLDELKSKDSNYLFNKIRMLEDPYPNAYIKTCDGKKILIKRVEIGE